MLLYVMEQESSTPLEAGNYLHAVGWTDLAAVD